MHAVQKALTSLWVQVRGARCWTTVRLCYCVCLLQTLLGAAAQSFCSDLLTSDRLHYSPDRQQDRNNPRKSFLQAAHAPQSCLQCRARVCALVRERVWKQERKKKENECQERSPKAFFSLYFPPRLWSDPVWPAIILGRYQCVAACSHQAFR